MIVKGGVIERSQWLNKSGIKTLRGKKPVLFISYISLKERTQKRPNESAD